MASVVTSIFLEDLDFFVLGQHARIPVGWFSLVTLSILKIRFSSYKFTDCFSSANSEYTSSSSGSSTAPRSATFSSGVP